MTFLSRLFLASPWTQSFRKRYQLRRSSIVHTLERLEAREMLTTFLVTSTGDSSDSGTLRWAIEQANGNVGADVIEFDASFNAAQTIVLNGTQLPAFLDTSGETTVAGPGQNLLTISGDDLSRVFAIDTGVSVTLTDLTISNGNAGDGAVGGAIQIAGTLTLEAVSFTDNVAVSGGAVYVSPGGTLGVVESSFEGNEASNDGGAIGNYGLLSVTDTQFTNNSAIYGGAVSSNTTDGQVRMSGATFNGNMAGYSGGAIYNFGSALLVSQSNLSNNSSSHGGAIANLDGGVLQLNQVTLNQNIATTQGGAIWNSGISDLLTGIISIKDCSIQGNYAEQYGGAISNTASITITGSDVCFNSSETVGGAVANYGSFTISAAVFSDNFSSEDGSGGAISNFGILSVSGSTFERNSAVVGGAIENLQSMSISNSTFSENDAGYGGGAISSIGLATISQSTFDSNHAEAGAAIRNGGAMTLSGSHFTNGTGTYGGAIENSGVLTDYYSFFADNSAWTGGAIVNFSPGKLTLVGSILERNSADIGGALTNYAHATMLVQDAKITDNSAGYNGGGIFNDGYATLEVTSSMIADNIASQGGAIFNWGTVEAVNSTLAGNSAQNGGGLYHSEEVDSNATLTVVNLTIADNHASFDGSGLYLYSTTKSARLVNTIIARNDRYGVVNDIYGTVDVARSTNNLIGPGGSGGLTSGINHNQIVNSNFDLGLGELDDNGGQSLTMALFPFSPAIDAGVNDVTLPIALPYYDQRQYGYPQGFRRVLGTTVDIGAYESHHGVFGVEIAENAVSVPVTLRDYWYVEPVTFYVSGGADQSLFGVHPVTGVLSFVTPPDYENPVDANLDNLYEVQVSVNDGFGNDSVQTINVKVTNLLETMTLTLTNETAIYELGSDGVVDSAADFQADAAATDYSTASLVVSISQGRHVKDRLKIASQGSGAGQIKVKKNKVLFEGVVIGTITGGVNSSSDLIVQFYASTTEAAVQALVKRVSFSTKSKDLPTHSRLLQMQIVNLAGTETNIASRQIQVVPKS